ncbi:SpoIIE family protein phosphatase [Leptospira sp. 'Mane']|uniref:SpoIIE family protein phosphatase n=1 Tax=Leptospira sp. 'Mane' TaxID=3387407 RepID=UPI00398AD753
MLKQRFLTSVLVFLFTSFAISAIEPVDLSELCSEKNCQGRIWNIKNEFHSDYIKSDFTPKEGWKEIRSFPIWLNQFYPSSESIANYTLLTHFDTPEKYFENETQMGIRMGEIGEVFTIYINGWKIASDGGISGEGIINFHRTIRGQVYHLPKKYLKPKDNLLVLHIIGDPRYDHTGLYLTRGYQIGYFDDLKYNSQDRTSLGLIAVYIAIGLYHFFLFLKRRRELHNLFFCGFAMGAGIYFFTRTNEIFELGLDSVITQKIELIILYLFVSCYYLFFSYLYFSSVNRYLKILFYFNASLAFITIFPPLYICEYILRLWQITAFFFVLPAVVYLLYKGVKTNASYSRNLLFGSIALILSAMFDILDSVVFNTGIAVSKYTFFIYMLGIATVLADKFTELHRQTEILNSTLEQKVVERTKELSKSLDSIKELKAQQDGDYFLTSLLLRPLGSNLSKNQDVKIEFLIQQKKKFQFKQWNSEIGGDLCVTHSVSLKNKNYTLFVNADAMGKSIQGAGGVLVLGSVFAAIVERTKMSTLTSNVYPERWLKNSFLELQKVFETFDGSMLVSLVLGLVDDSTGTVYYINAEHPSLVLYRDGIAEFLDQEMQLRKLGIRITEGNLSVRIFAMKPGDILISGSDGRDDLLIGTEGENKRIINEDETKFLQFVEKGDGNLSQIAEHIQKFGDLTDDLSLLRIEYCPENAISLDLRPMWKDAIALHKKKMFKESLQVCEEVGKYFPEETRALFLASLNKYHMGDWNDSADMAERVRLREPENLKVLLNLTFIHIKLKNWNRANVILNEARKLAPDHKRIHQLDRFLSKQGKPIAPEEHWN